MVKDSLPAGFQRCPVGQVCDADQYSTETPVSEFARRLGWFVVDPTKTGDKRGSCSNSLWPDGDLGSCAGLAAGSVRQQVLHALWKGADLTHRDDTYPGVICGGREDVILVR